MNKQRIQLSCLFFFSLITLLILTSISTSTGIARSGEEPDSDHRVGGKSVVSIVSENGNGTDLINVYLPLLASPNLKKVKVEFIGQIGGEHGAPGHVSGVAVAGDYAYTSDARREDLHVINITNPAAPVVTGSLTDLDGTASDLAVDGNYAYVAGGFWGGMDIIDVTDPTDPQNASYIDLLGHANDVRAAEGYAYLASPDTGLYIIDVGNPAQPVEVGFLVEPAAFLALQANYAYVVDTYRDILHVVDVTKPAKPIVVGSYESPGGSAGVDVRGDYAYLVDSGRDKLRVINVGDPAKPLETGSCDVAGEPKEVAVAGNYAYVVAGDEGLRVIDVSNPAHPAEIGFYDTSGDAQRIAAAGGYAYVADGDGGLVILRITISKR